MHVVIYIHDVKNQNIYVQTNPIALRKAKIVNDFGLSKCNRVNTMQSVKVLCFLFKAEHQIEVNKKNRSKSDDGEIVVEER